MAGHSKWSNIKRRKGAVDAARAKVFTKLGREIQVAVREGGPDPETNRNLKDVIARAKASNMPNDNIKRSIERASGSSDGANLETIIYEGYGPAGIAVMVKTLSDNRNRTAGDIRHLFDKYGGNLGTHGCVAFQFKEAGSIVIERTDEIDEDSLMLAALEAGASDFISDPEFFEIICEPEQYEQVRDELDAKYSFADLSLGPVPITYVQLEDEEVLAKFETMIEKIEDHDDVSEVYHNLED